MLRLLPGCDAEEGLITARAMPCSTQTMSFWTKWRISSWFTAQLLIFGEIFHYVQYDNAFRRRISMYCSGCATLRIAWGQSAYV